MSECSLFHTFELLRSPPCTHTHNLHSKLTNTQQDFRLSGLHSPGAVFPLTIPAVKQCPAPELASFVIVAQL